MFVNESELFNLVINFQSYNLDNLTNDALLNLYHQLLGISHYEPQYQTVADDLLAFFREGWSEEEARRTMLSRCNGILSRVSCHLYANGQMDVTTLCSIEQLKSLLCYANDRETKALIQALGEQLKITIKNDMDLRYILKHMDTIRRTELIRLLGEQLKTIIKNGTHLIEVLWYLGDTGRIALIYILEDYLEKIVKNTDELKKILHYSNKFYSVVDSTAFIKTLVEKLKTIIKNGGQLTELLLILDFSGRTALIQALGKQLQLIIDHVGHLGYFLEFFVCTGQTALIQALGEQLKTIIKDEADLSYILGRLDPSNEAILAINRAIILRNVGCCIIGWAVTNQDFKKTLKAILAEDQPALQHDETHYAHNVLLSYILDDKHTECKLSRFFAVSNIPQKLQAAKWLLGLLTKEISYTQAAFDAHQAMLQSGQLHDIFQLPAIQACIILNLENSSQLHQDSLMAEEVKNVLLMNRGG